MPAINVHKVNFNIPCPIMQYYKSTFGANFALFINLILEKRKEFAIISPFSDEFTSLTSNEIGERKSIYVKNELFAQLEIEAKCSLYSVTSYISYILISFYILHGKLSLRQIYKLLKNET